MVLPVVSNIRSTIITFLIGAHVCGIKNTGVLRVLRERNLWGLVPSVFKSNFRLLRDVATTQNLTWVINILL